MANSYSCYDGRQVSIELNDDMTVTVQDQNGRQIGRLGFAEVDDENGSALKLIWAFLDQLDVSYKRQGIGRECLKRAREYWGLPIFAENNDGQTRDDGSHLTGDAPSFVAKMRAEGLIVGSTPDSGAD